VKHVLCIYLRQWPIDRLRRRHSGLRHKPLVLFETIGNRQLVTHISPETPRSVRVGMTLPQARAHHAALISLAITPADDLRSLEALGRWLMRFSPSISIAPPSSIFLDAGGLQRIFGGLHNLRLRVADALSALRITADVAIAPTPGAAWALAGFGHNQPRVVGQDELPDILHPLPPQALRLDPITLELLHTLGIHTIGDLLKIHRDDLAVRFGPAILQRIDQATGAVHEPLVFLEHHSPIQARSPCSNCWRERSSNYPAAAWAPGNCAFYSTVPMRRRLKRWSA
jgi:protein ImuB